MQHARASMFLDCHGYGTAAQQSDKDKTPLEGVGMRSKSSIDVVMSKRVCLWLGLLLAARILAHLGANLFDDLLDLGVVFIFGNLARILADLLEGHHHLWIL